MMRVVKKTDYGINAGAMKRDNILNIKVSKKYIM